ncbi:D-xylose transport system substrate-binding protein [Anaerosolibacter carboniphilus]|uniref:D-xylose transport system substrate-binding protein n=1 Tax=Anaerosolibacter carboniphilus TaxID=1417629 RepID=A0A841KZY7_9FIRM|nr:substrate-binding domain-containing protein [Anaerosolibacter carboniphilus]MBB6215709.1 D-xylose transport system substrate-binding protein [Anaerosolibacter carboniphilus]
MKTTKTARRILLSVLVTILIILIHLTIQSLIGEKNINTMDPSNIEVVDNRIKIGFSLGTLKEERWIKDRDILMGKVKELGAEIIVQNANNDDQDQLKQVKYLLDQGIDVLIIVPNDLEKAATAVEMAKRQGVKVISYDRLVLKSNVDAYISFDNVKVGQMMAQAVLDHIQEGQVLVINGATSDYNTKMIKEGYDIVLQPEVKSGRIRIISEEWAPNWMSEFAFKVTDELLQNENAIHAIIAGNDGLADGIIGALSEHRLAGKTVVVGQDADLAACQRVVEGTQLMTVYKPIGKLTDAAAELAIKLAKGEPLGLESTIYDGKYNIPYFMVAPVAVDKENIDETIIKDGFHMGDEVYRNSSGL